MALLRTVGIDPIIIVPRVDETPHRGESPDARVLRLARAKADTVPGDRETLVIAADTLVVLDDEALGKPDDHVAASRMLRRLSARTHTVLTGLSVRRGSEEVTEVVSTDVTFRSLSDDEIDWHVGRGASDDKAGAYGIQDAAAAFVDRIDGSYTNVVGLPLSVTVTAARELGFDLLTGTELRRS